MENNGIVLEVFIDPNHPERVSEPEARGLRHIVFTVDRIDKVDDDIEPIKYDWLGRRYTFAKDLDGQSIEMKER